MLDNIDPPRVYSWTEGVSAAAADWFSIGDKPPPSPTLRISESVLLWSCALSFVNVSAVWQSMLTIKCLFIICYLFPHHPSETKAVCGSGAPMNSSLVVFPMSSIRIFTDSSCWRVLSKDPLLSLLRSQSAILLNALSPLKSLSLE